MAELIVYDRALTAIEERRVGCYLQAKYELTTAYYTDTDHDTLPDDWEMTHFGNLAQGPVGDADHDGLENLDEFLRGSPPALGALGFGTFTAATRLACAGNPVAVAVADLNLDGKQDLVVGLLSADAVAARLGNGDGTFQAAVQYAAGDGVIAVALGDVNRDGVPDLVAVSCYDDSLHVRLGAGDGTFGADTVLATGTITDDTYDALTVADVNRDGNLDISVAELGQQSLKMRLGNGDGTFQAATTVALAYPGPLEHCFADFDGDGVLDLVVVGYYSGYHGLDVYTGDGDGTFTAKEHHATSGTAQSVDVGDLDGDGILDLVACSVNDVRLNVYRGRGDGTFYTYTDMATASYPRAGELGDFDGDGILDLALVSYTGNQLVIHLGNGDRTFTSARQYASGPGPYGLALGDLDGDGAQDLVVTSGADDALYLFLGVVDADHDRLPDDWEVTYFGDLSGSPWGDPDHDGLLTYTEYDLGMDPDLGGMGDGTYGAKTAVGSGWSQVQNLAIGDLNRDGKQDLVVVSRAGSLKVCTGAGDGTFTVGGAVTTGNDALGTVVVDLNRDGYQDLAVASSGDDKLNIHLGNGDGTFQTPTSYGAGDAQRVAAGDLNGDRVPDLAVVAHADGNLRLFLNTGSGAFTAGNVYGLGGGDITDVILTDVDGDGDLDAAATLYSSGQVRVLRGDGAGGFTTGVTYTASAAPCHGTAADLNNDGRPDLAVATNSTSGTVDVWLNNGDGSFAAKTSYAVGRNAYTVAAGDWNGDRHVDLAVTVWTDNTIAVLTGKGDGTFNAATFLSTGTQPDGIVVGDLDGDGALDLANASIGDGLDVFLGTATEPPTVAFSAASAAVAESAGTATLTVDLSHAYPDTVTVQYATADGTATAGSDYTARTDSLSFAPGEVSKTITVAITSDAVEDPAETFTVTLASPTNAVLGATVVHTLTILDDDPDTLPDAWELAAFGDLDENGFGDPDRDGLSNRDEWLAGTAPAQPVLGDGTFLARTRILTGSRPAAVAVGDVNHDGKPDVVVASRDDDQINVHRGKGDGTFETRLTTATGDGPIRIVLLDLDRDGNLDAVTVSANDSQLNVHRGNGDGTFAAKQSQGAGTYGLVAGDMDGDGFEEVIVTHSSPNWRASVFWNPRDGTLPAPVDYDDYYYYGGTGDPPAIGDVNNDGLADMISAQQRPYVCGVGILMGKAGGGTLSVSQFGVGYGFTGPMAGDLDGDGDCDLCIWGVGGPGLLRLYPGDGSGGYGTWTDHTLPAGIGRGAFGEFNLDGRLDLVWARPGTDDLALQFGTAAGSWDVTPTLLTTGDNPVGLAVTDLDGDRALDLVVISDNDDRINVHLGRALVAPTVSSFALNGGAAQTGYRNVRLVHTAGALLTHFMASESASFTGAAWLPYQSMPTFRLSAGDGTKTVYFKVKNAVNESAAASDTITLTELVDTDLDGLPDTWETAHFGDLDENGFGDPDHDGLSNRAELIAGSDPAAGALGMGAFLAGVAYATGDVAADQHGAVAVCDLDGDGHQDLAVASGVDGKVNVHLGNGDGTFAPAVVYAAGSGGGYGYDALTVADLNHDGVQDVLVAASNEGTVYVLLGKGDGALQAGIGYPCNTRTESVVTADFNEDGWLDVAAGAYGDRSVYIYLCSGDGTLPAGTRVAGGNSSWTCSLAVADVDGDWVADLVFVTQYPDQYALVCLPGRGDGAFLSARVLGLAPTTGHLAVADFDNDEFPDAAVTLGDKVAICRGVGDGSFTAGAEYTAGTGNGGIAAGDFQGDGLLDLAVAVGGDNAIGLHRGNGNGTFQARTTLATGGAPCCVAIGDFNGDGAQDLAALSADDNTVSIHLGLADADRDGLPDDWEQQIIDANAGDGITTIAHVLPGDDFDGDSFPNLLEYRYGTSPISASSRPAAFYVNDSATTNDEWCTAVGNDANDGLSPATPKATVQALLDAYNLEPGDRVRLDTGTYAGAIAFAADDSGSEGNPVTLEASPYGVTLNRGSTSSGAWVVSSLALYLELTTATSTRYPSVPQRWLRLTGGWGGIWTGRIGFELSRCEITDNLTEGVNVWGESAVFDNCLVRNCATGLFNSTDTGNVLVRHCTVYGTTYGMKLGAGISFQITDSIVWVDGAAASALPWGLGMWGTDYNNVYATNGATGASGGPNGISADPLFVDAAGGDFHLKSTAGSYHGGAWTADAVNSPCLDVANPAGAFANEPEDNGDRANLGAYGNTEFASKGALPSVGFAAVGSSVAETAGSAVLSVQLSRATGAAVTVAYATADGTATAGSDYTATSGTVTFAAGETARTITVSVGADTAVEMNEWFTVTLSSPTNAVLGAQTAHRVDIQDVSPGNYLVIDVSGGSAATSYPVSYQPDPPDLSDPIYKTTRIVLRRVRKGSFTMGSPEGELGRALGDLEKQHEVALTQDFYLGVFELTQKQWYNVMATDPSFDKGDTRPLEAVRWNALRGGDWPGTPAGSGEPAAGSAVGLLRARTGLLLDLPTDAQWEYACRAGTTTALHSGKDLTAIVTCPNVAELCRYKQNRLDGKGGYSDAHTAVGSYLPNAWGLYDMLGNVSEYCLDWFTDSLGSAPCTDPMGPPSATGRVLRSGNHGEDANKCRSGRRVDYGPDDPNKLFGLRLAMGPATRAQFAAPSSTVAETAGVAVVTVTLSGPSPDTVTVAYAVTGGTATGGGTDYTLGGSGTLTFSAGETSKTIPVTIVNDALEDPSETVLVTLSSPTSAVLGSTLTHTLWILDDDASPAWVVNTNDSGTGSLRAAIDYANAHSGTTIRFAIPGTGVQTIRPQSALPTLTVPVTLDGYTQPGASANTLAVGSDAVLLIEIDGSQAGSGYGLTLAGGDSTVRGLVINRAPAGGILLQTFGGNTVEGCFVGTNAAGTAAAANTQSGVVASEVADNVIGGTTPTSRNVLSGNGQNGIHIAGSGAQRNTVAGNYIGTTASGMADLGNQDGVYVQSAPGNRVGGLTVGARNVISGNASNGVFIWPAECSGTQVQGNYIGTNATGTAAVPNGGISGYAGVAVFGSSALVGGVDAGAGNLISGNLSSGVYISADDAVVQGNLIGTDVTGTSKVANGGFGILLYGNGAQIGGATAAARNVISGNGTIADHSGISLQASRVQVQGNYVGTDVSGTVALPNSGAGIYVGGIGDKADNLIGGTNAGEGNVISGNAGAGVYLHVVAHGTVVAGNLVGLATDGSTPLGNGADGVHLRGVWGNTVGGTTAAARNVVSCSAGCGIVFSAGGAGGNEVLGNYIGTDVTGALARGNQGGGVALWEDNYGNRVGGTQPGAGNLIAHNVGPGVLVNRSSGNPIRGNAIFGNSGLGIELQVNGNNDGVTPNDAGDGDTGANNLQNFPVIQAAYAGATEIALCGTLDTPSPQTCSLDFFANDSRDGTNYGEGQVYLGSGTPRSDGRFAVALTATVAVGKWISATATDAAGNTSEFSLCFAATASDGDSLPDDWEWLWWGNLAQGPGDDPDLDDSTNAQELAANTDPTDPDTDNDGVNDGAEATNGTNPLLDDYAPTGLAVASANPPVPTAATPYAQLSTRDATLDLTWTPASDPSGVAGYSWVFDRTADTVPDATSDGATPPVLCTAAADGIWFLHARVADALGNWSATLHHGPWVVDTTSRTWLILDISAGPAAAYYPVAYQADPPDLTDPIYKTTHIVLRRIPAGGFIMGSPVAEYGHDSTETQHPVTLTQPFYMAVFELTQKQCQLVTGLTPSYWAGDTRPVETVSWDDARGGCWPGSDQLPATGTPVALLRAKAGLGFDLPTEAQWEYACRAGTTRTFNDYRKNSGQGLDYDGSPSGTFAEVGWYYWNTGGTHHTVGTLQPNAWGCFDLHGNVAEWCLDGFVGYPADPGGDPVIDPVGDAAPARRAFRGGQVSQNPGGCRSAMRQSQVPTDRDRHNGFRLCLPGADAVMPRVEWITSSTANGTYRLGEAVNVALRFTTPVTLAGGDLLVTLDTGTVLAVDPSDLSDPSDQADLVYTVGAGEHSTDLTVTGLALGTGATLRDADGRSVDLTLPAASNLGQLKDLVIVSSAVQFAAATSSAAESAGTVAIPVTVTPASTQPVTVSYAVVAGGSTASGSGVDYTLLGSGTLSFTAGETTKDVQVTVVDDWLVEASETVQLQLSAPVGATLGTPTTHALTLTDNDHAPTDVTLDPASVAENEPVGTAVGTLTTTDADTANGDTHTYSLVSGSGSTDNSAFTVDGATLRTAVTFDFEAKSKGSRSVRIRTVDRGGQSFEKALAVAITDANDPPTDIALSNASVAENQPVGTTVGTFTTTDQDAGQTFTYSLVSGTGSADNGSFSLTGSALKTGAGFDYEARTSYAIRVRSTDNGTGNRFVEKAFSITITDVDDTPPQVTGLVRKTPAAAATNASQVTFEVRFSEAVTGVATGNFHLDATGEQAGGAVLSVGGSGATWTVTVSTVAGTGTVSVDLDQSLSGIHDLAGNPLQTAFSAGEVYALDRVAPTVTGIVRQTPAGALTNATQVVFGVAFSEAVTGLGTAHFSLDASGNQTGAAVASVGGSGTAWTVTVNTAAGTGSLGLDLNQSLGTIADAVGNVLAEAYTAGEAYTVDRQAPRVSSVSAVTASPTNGSTVTFSVGFDEAVSGFDGAADVTVNRTGTVASTGVTVTPVSGTTYTVEVTGVTGDGGLSLTVRTDSGVADAAENGLAAGGTSASVTLDHTPPTNTPTVRTLDLDGDGWIDALRWTFSEPVRDSTVSLANFSLGSAGVATGLSTGTLTDDAEVILLCADGLRDTATRPVCKYTKGTLADLAGNLVNTTGNTTAQDGAPPVLLTAIADDNTVPVTGIDADDTVVLTFSEPTAKPVIDAGNIDEVLLAAGGTHSWVDGWNEVGAASGWSTDGLRFTVFLTTSGGVPTVQVGDLLTLDGTTIADAAGNRAVTLPGLVFSGTFDTDPAVVSVTRQTPANALTNAAELGFAVQFNKAVTGFAANTVSVVATGGQAAATVTGVAGTGAQWTVTVGTVAAAEGTVTVLVDRNLSQIVDPLAPGSFMTQAFTGSESYTVDRVAPTVSIGAPSLTLTQAGPVTFTVTYSGADSISFDHSAVTLNRTGTANGTVDDPAGTGTTTRTLTVRSLTGDGTLGVSLAAGTATDLAGNAAPDAGPSATLTVDNTAPSAPTGVGLAAADDSGASATDRVTNRTSGLTLTGLAEAGSTVRLWRSGLEIASDTAAAFAAPGFDIALGQGTHEITATATDAAGNPSAASAPLAITVDTTAPSVEISPPSTTLTNVGPVTFTVTYTGADAVSLAAADVVLNRTGTASATVAPVTGTGSVNRTVTLTPTAGDGALGISLNTGTATDLAGNPAPAAGPSATCSVDNTGPVLAITAPLTGDHVNSATVVTFTATGGTAPQLSVNGTTWTASLSGVTILADIAGFTALADGPFTLRLQDTDAAGNAVTVQQAGVIRDDAPPAAPTGLDLVAADDTGVSDTDDITSRTDGLTIRGTAEAGTTVRLRDEGGMLRATGTAEAFADPGLDVALAAGEHQLTATATDAAGNPSAVSAPLSITVDTTAPTVTVQPLVASPTDATPLPFRISFSESVVSLDLGDIQLVNGTAGTGDFSVRTPGQEWDLSVTPPAADATVQVTVPATAATDTAGNSNTAGAASVVYEAPREVRFDAASQPVSEGAGSVTVRVQLDRPGVMRVSVPFAVGGTASRPADHDLASGTVQIEAGQDPPEAAITFQVAEDALDEDAETVVLTLGPPVHGNLVAPSTHTVTLVDDDVVLDVVSAYGTPTPTVGAHTYTSGTHLTGTMAGSPVLEGTRRRQLTGWALSGGNTGSGSGSSTGEFVLSEGVAQQHTLLTWVWATQYLLTVATSGTGSVGVAPAATGGWYDAGAVVTLTASPGRFALPLRFGGWSGDVPAGSEQANPLTLTLDQARAVTASFVSNDTDNDLLGDDWELLYFGNLTEGRLGDPDQDGYNNYAEFKASPTPANPRDRTSVAADRVCRSGASGGHWYAYKVWPGTWEEARIECLRLGGHLATLSDLDENTFVFGLLPGTVLGAALGASEVGANGSWEWVLGGAVQTSLDPLWEFGQKLKAGEDYLAMNGPAIGDEFRYGLWRAQLLTTPSIAGFVCEWENSGDADADGLADSWEVRWFCNLLGGPGDDPDGDALTNLQEQALDSDPTQWNAVYTVTGTAAGGTLAGTGVHLAGRSVRLTATPDSSPYTLAVDQWLQVLPDEQTAVLQTGGYAYDTAPLTADLEVRVTFRCTGGAPTPSPLAWETPPQPVAGNWAALSMTAVESTHPLGVDYRFDLVAPAGAARSSGWITARTYEFPGLNPDTTYTFEARARNRSGDQVATQPTPQAQARTGQPPPSTLEILEPDGVADFPDRDRSYTIGWRATCELPTATVSFYLDADTTGFPTHSPVGTTTTITPADSHQLRSTTFQALLIPTGTYYLWGLLNDGYHAPVKVYCLHPFVVPSQAVSEMSCQLLSDPTQAFGQAACLQAAIQPLVAGPVVFVFRSVDAAGVALGTPIEVGPFLSSGLTGMAEVQWAAPGTGTWDAYAYWPGNAQYSPARSPSVRFTVTPAAAQLELILARTTLALGTREIGGLLGLVAGNAGVSLAGEPVTVAVQGPAGATQSVPATCTAAGQFVAAVPFASTGLWQVRAEFAGSANLGPCAPTAWEAIRIVQETTYLILCQGSFPATNPEGVPAHGRTLATLYAKSRGVGLDAEDIQYLTLLNEPERDAVPSEASLGSAITDWASSRMNAAPAPLYVVLVNHGSIGAFHMGRDVLTPADLGRLLDTLQNERLTDPIAREQKIVVVLGACHAGSFIRHLRGANRIIIASADTWESSYRGASLAGDPEPDGEYFVSALFHELTRTDNSLFEAFQVAAPAARERAACTTPVTPPAGPTWVEDRLHFRHRVEYLIDNGDDTYTYRLTSAAMGSLGGVPKPLDYTVFGFPDGYGLVGPPSSQYGHAWSVGPDPDTGVSGLKFLADTYRLGAQAGTDETEWFQFTLARRLDLVTVGVKAGPSQDTAYLPVPVPFYDAESVALGGYANNIAATDNSQQHPLLEDDGDGIGNHYLTGYDGDGLVAQHLFFGTQRNAAGDLSLLQVRESLCLGSADPAPEFWAEFNRPASVIGGAWIEIKPPNFGGAGADLTMQYDMNLTPYYATQVATDAETQQSRASWTSSRTPKAYDPALLANPGLYQVLYYGQLTGASDSVSGRCGWVFRASGLATPTPFGLLSPADGETVTAPAAFAWEPSSSVAGQVQYLFRLWRDSQATDLHYEAPLTTMPLAVVGREALPDGDYWWEVIAVDAGGNATLSVRRHVTARTPNQSDTLLVVKVYDAETAGTIPTAMVTISGYPPESAANGVCHRALGLGSYQVAVAAGSQYAEQSLQVTVSGGILLEEFALQRLGTRLSLSLQRGWNLLSLPIQPYDNAVAAVLKGAGKGTVPYRAVYGWNGTAFYAATTLDALTGYWVYCPEDCRIEVAGQALPAPQRTLPAGWSLVGASHYWPWDGARAGDGKCLGWSGAAYRTLGAQAEPETDLMVPGAAYWIYLDEPTDVQLGP